MGRWLGLRTRRVASSLPVGYKVMLPFLALTLISGVTFAAVAALELSSVATAQADSNLVRARDAAVDRVAAFSASQVLVLRLLSGTSGLPAAVEAGDRDALQTLLLPMLNGDSRFLGLRVSVLAASGDEVLTIRPDPADPQGCYCTYGRRLGPWSSLAAVVAEPDHLQSGVASDLDGPMVYTIGPIGTDAEPAPGALLIAQPVGELLTAIRGGSNVEAGLYFADGSRLTATRGFPAGHNLSSGDRSQVLAGRSLPTAKPVLGNYEMAFIPWTLRGAPVGYIGLAVPHELPRLSDPVLLLLAFTFVAAVGLCLLAAYFVNRAVSRPLALLVAATNEVAAGNLSHHSTVHADDETGRLAAAFNTMVDSLREHRAVIERTMDETLEALAAAIDARDPNTHGHSYRVADYAAALGAAAGLASGELGVLRRACLVHDIGKIGVPDRVLLKVGPLTEEELKIVQAHPVIGFQVLRHLSWEREVLEVVRHHHERWDGTGYPDGLAGPEIPALAALTSVADTLDAMVSDRVYRPTMSFDDAVAEIRRGSGRQFDPAVVELLVVAEPSLRDIAAAANIGVPFKSINPVVMVAS